MLSLSAAASLLAAASAVLAAQLPLDFRTAQPALAPETSPFYIASDSFTTLTHSEIPHTSVRIKKSDGWCDPSVEAYTGYIDNGPRHLFFYYFPSRRDSAKDDLVLWTNGGPGCSSSMGLAMELGPCTILPDGNSTKPNPYSWTGTANMIFIDQPVGVGYSYAESGIHVDTTEEAGVDVHAFLNIFFEAFPDLKDRAFHLSGESYGGRYLPVFASEIMHQNHILTTQKAKRHPINLKSVIIGNGLTDDISMTTSYYEQSCSAANGLGRPVLDIKSCIAMQQDVQRCTKWLEKVCRTNLEQPACDIASSHCIDTLLVPFMEGHINPYDISKPCTTLNEDLCYPETSVIAQYLNHPWIRQRLGVDSHAGKFASCSNKVGEQFAATRDGLAPTFYHLTGLLENGVRVLIYVGEYDWICNFIGNRRMVEALEWSGQAGFRDAKLDTWQYNGSQAGSTKSFGGLTYATVERAGHMVPYDKPQEALQLFSSWIAGKPI